MLKTLSLYALLALTTPAQELKTATDHPVQYYLYLPQNWTATQKWPVIVIIESANRQFQSNAEVFVRARQSMPFILVAPLVVTNGGANYRRVPTYHYSDTVWNEIERVGGCQFDMAGIAAIVRDVKRLYGGEDRYFITGWEAGGHTVWAMLLQHPEALRAAAPVCTNYRGRCMEDAQFSSSPQRTKLPVTVFGGEADPGWKQGQPLYTQSQEAIKIAREHGYGSVSESVAPRKGHEPLADEVLAYFYSLLTAR
jgi:poly(3-hydroxybutyrate) depolymerase